MHFWQHITKHQKGILLYVVASKGSSPGRQGFRMWVSETREMYGSIGGGIMEHKLVELAKSKLQNNDLKIVFKHQVHSKSVTGNQSGMICSGEQSIVLIPIREKDIPVIEQIVNCLQSGNSGTIKISPQLGPNELKFNPTKPNEPYTFNFVDEQNWQYSEQIGFKKFAYIIGGGHVSHALSKILIDLDFHCTIIDDRQNLHTLENNSYAHQKIMKNLGYTEEQLSTIHSPIGMDIKSRTPQEIAISIGAQLIQLCNKNLP